jgi:integrase
MQSHHRKGPEGPEARRPGDPLQMQAEMPGGWIARDQRRKRKEFWSLEEAKAWRDEAKMAVRSGAMRARSEPVTLRKTAEAWLEGARSSAVVNRSGDQYKPSAIRAYEQALRDRLLPDLGAKKLTDITRADVQALADRMLADGGIDASTIRNTIIPLRAIYRRVLARGQVTVNPTLGLELPAVRGKRDRIASPAEAEALLDALPVEDRALWATAMYAGLRHAERRALASRT